MSTVFGLAALPVIPLWALMIVAPHWRSTRRIVEQPWSYAPLAVTYTILVAPRAAEVLNAVVVNPSLDTVAPLLGTPAGATIAWVHFLAFDVFIGRWEYLDSRERRIPTLVMAPILIVTFLLGPFGFLTYLVVRTAGYARRHG
jgi:hypothetical protein